MTGPREWLNSARTWLRPALHRLLEQKWINVGLRGKMGLIVVVGLVGLLAVFAFLSVSATRRVAEQVSSERVMLADMTASVLDSNLRHIRSLLTMLAEQPELKAAGPSPASRLDALRAGSGELARLSLGLYRLDTAGQVTAATGGETMDWAALAARRPARGSAVYSLEPGSARAVVETAVTDPAGRPAGFLAALIDLEDPKLFSSQNPLELGPTGTLDVVDAAGQVLMSTNVTRAGPGEPAQAQLRALLAAGTPRAEICLGCYASLTPDARDEVVAFAPLAEAPWGVVVRQTADEVYAPVRRLTVQFLVLAVATMGGALGLVWVTTNSVIKPVQLLTAAAQRIAAGDLATPIAYRRADEIGALAGSFDAMRSRLKQSMDETQALNQALDARIQERTQAAWTAQEEAQLARDDLRAVIDALSDELVVIGADYRVLQMNRTAQARRGGAPADGRKCYELMHGDERCRVPRGDCPLEQVLQSGEPARVTYTDCCPQTGADRVVDVVASPLRDAAGRVTRIVELARDMTEERQMRAALERRNEQLAILNAVANTANQSLNLSEILGRALDEVLRLTGIDVGAVFLVDDTAGGQSLMACRGLSEDAAQTAAQLGLLDGSCGGVLDRQQTVLVPDVSAYHGRRARSLQREQICTLLHVPLVAQGTALGSMCVGTHEPRDFAHDELDLLSAIGCQIAVAVENARLYAEVQRKEFVRGELFRKAIAAQEDERKRIARELHDDTSQALTALLYAAEATQEAGDPAEAECGLQSIRDLAQHTLEGVQKLIWDLRPSVLDHLGLVPALRSSAEARLASRGTRVTIETRSEPRRLPAEVETALFRVVQEAIANIARHACARNARITFDFGDDEVTVLAEDDGVGFDVNDHALSPDTQRGLGLLGMRERVELLGGAMELQTAPGAGTHLTIRVPLGERSIGHG